ncbi:hypothetical protein CP556_12755 [Natrinema sp. CBA1119]|uniref:hypothetical protein n=1 Tax=Natrinema sp. CBA1119 TaxID=1608465 RepID=UPI000BF34083|nr:hypothetical protein [Natrinema sp. CBA1119]PGF16904.1 hypothetical protein CP556_12755 [Natrinema sp. CBA1119]
MPFRRPSATFFSVATGWYVGLFGLGVTGLALGVGYVTPWPLTIGACVGLLAAAGSYTRADLATRLVRTCLPHLLAGVPFVLVFSGALSPVIDIPKYESWLTTWLSELLVITVAGFVFYLVSINRHVAIRYEQDSVVVDWIAEPDARYRRLVRAASVGVGFGCLVLGFVVDPIVNPFPGIGGVLLVQAFFSGRRREYVLFESGLCIHRPGTINYQFVPRKQLRSVDLTDDRLAIRRGFPWPFPIRCATATIRRPRQVADALTRVLTSTPVDDRN